MMTTMLTTTSAAAAAAAAIPNCTTTIPTDITAVDTNNRSFWNNLELILFPSINEEDKKKKKMEDDNPNLILARWDNIWEDDKQEQEQEELEMEIEIKSDLLSSTPSMSASSSASASASIESLTNFIEVWARISLQNDKGLTTPVTSSKFKIISNNDNSNDNNNNMMMTMKLIFRPPKRYLSYKEQKSMEKNGSIDRKNAKVDAWSPGGVQIEIKIENEINNEIDNEIENEIIQQQRTNMNTSSKIGIILRRCDIDGDTIIKRTTERAIIRRLDDAIRIWKKNSTNININIINR